MNRRISMVFGALAAAMLGAGCTTFSDNDAVARVGDDSLSRSQLVTLIEGEDAPDDAPTASSTPGSSPAPQDSGPDKLSGDEARQWINVWVQEQLLKSVLADSGGTVTDNDRQQGRQALQQQQGFSGLPPQQQDLYVELNATSAAIGRLNAKPEQHRQSYEAGVQESGVACVGAILVQNQNAARDVISQIEGGANFTDVASSRNLDQRLAQRGGDLGCAAAQDLRQQMPRPLFQALVDTEVGEISDPVRLPQGTGQQAWVVVRVQPFDQVRGQLAQVFGQQETTKLVRRKANDVEIYVDPRYGSYDFDNGVTPLGGASTGGGPAVAGLSGS